MNIYKLIAKEKKEKTGKLDIGNCGLAELPNELFELTWLKVLIVSNFFFDHNKNEWVNSINDGNPNFLNNLPPGLISFNELQTLIIRGDYISPWDISKIENLPTNLSELDISSNKIKTLENLPNSLKRLSVYNNQISRIENLPQGLLEIDFDLNKIEIIENLPNDLIKLDIQNNIITKLNNLPFSLRELSIRDNQINELKNLPDGLIRLDISYNKIKEISNLPRAIRYLDIRGNTIKDLSPLSNLLIFKNTEINGLELVNKIKFDVATITNPPPEVVHKGNDAIIQYLKELQKGKEYIFEAKLLIVGEPGSGKTTLYRKLKDQNADLPREDESTKGIDIHSITFYNNIDVTKEFKINLWDFGGQEIYHATHQFFLTKRSLYLLVSDSRKEDTDFNYWLQIIELLSNKSPVIIIQNEKGGRKSEIDQRGLKGRFSNIVEFFSLDLSTDIKILSKLKDSINYFCQHLEHVGQELPKNWVDVRKALEIKSNSVSYIKDYEYFMICNNNGIKENEIALFLSEFLHDLGSFLHFQKDAILKHYIFLKNDWATKAVYAIMDDDIVKSNQKGHFNRSDVSRILDHSAYFGMHDEVLQLMTKFELSYRLPELNTEQYIATQLLTRIKPIYPWVNSNNLQLKFHYDFMPKGLLSRLIVRLHRYAKNVNELWRTGAIFYREETKAEVIETYGIHNIDIRVEGKNKRELLTIITEEIDILSKSYIGLIYEKLVPCNCPSCNNSIQSYFFKYSELIYRKEKGKEIIECGISFNEVNINNLLGNIFIITSKNKINIFISYSKKDKVDLERFKKAIDPYFEYFNIFTWDDSDLIPSSEWEKIIKVNLINSDFIVFLTSIDSISTQYIKEIEFKIAHELQKNKRVFIIPIILRACKWDRTILKDYTALPHKGYPVHSSHWCNQDEAWTNVANGVERMILEFEKK